MDAVKSKRNECRLLLDDELFGRLTEEAKNNGLKPGQQARMIIAKHYADIDRNGNRALLENAEEAISKTR